MSKSDSKLHKERDKAGCTTQHLKWVMRRDKRAVFDRFLPYELLDKGNFRFDCCSDQRAKGIDESNPNLSRHISTNAISAFSME